MKFASFEITTETGRTRRLGAYQDGTIIDLTAGYGAALAAKDEPTPTEIAQSTVPPDMLTFIQRGERALTAAKDAVKYFEQTHASIGPNDARIEYDCDEIRLLSPLPRPETIRDFITFEDHIGHFRDEVPAEWYELPMFYKGNPNSTVHPGEMVEWPPYTEKFDYELEVAAVVGKQGRNIDAADASEYIFGYTIFNDFSARDIQAKERTVGLGPAKGKDFANGFGPFLVTPDEIDIDDARMTAHINGEKWSDGNLGRMHHSFADLIAHASWGETIYPGEVLGTGTVGGGCGPEVGKWLQPGDTIELTVDGIGTLTHHIGNQQA